MRTGPRSNRRCSVASNGGIGPALKLNAALVAVEQRMSELVSDEGTSEIPRAWFSWHDIEKKLRPLVYAAEQEEARSGV